MTIGLKHTGDNNNRIKYTIDFINEHPLNPGLHFLYQQDGEKNIYYGEDDSQDYLIPRNCSFLNSDLVRFESYTANNYRYRDQLFYSVERESKKEQPFIKDNHFQFDILGMIFFHISRYEEYHCPASMHNEWDTMFEHEQFLVSNQIEKQAVVDQVLSCFYSIFTAKEILRKTSFTISHDIDHIEKFASSFSIFKKVPGHLLRRRSFKYLGLLIEQFSQSISDHKLDPYHNFDWLLTEKDIDKEIYFLVGGKHKVDTAIPLNHEGFIRSVAIAKERNYRIGIHPSYSSWNNADIIKSEKRNLERIIKSSIDFSRQHYLHFDFRHTPDSLLKSGIKEDASLGYNRHIGFRCGTGFSYKLYDFTKEESSSLIEKPLSFMDSSCWHESKRNKHKFKSLFDQFFKANQTNTHINCNFHNSFFDEASFNGLDFKSMYLELLENV